MGVALFFLLLLQEETLDRIAFGSCAKEDQPQPIWDAVVASKPELWIWLGDNIYGDTEDMAVMRSKYAELAAQPGYQKLRRICPILATWDDHDYGVNDGGREYRVRKESQKEFCDFFGLPDDAPQRRREGIYDAKVFGPEGRRVQVIVLDTRYFRSPLKRRDTKYIPNEDPAATILGEAQWAWLEAELKKPAEVRIVVSSIQVVPEDHAWEKWSNFPKEREKLFALIRDTKAAGVLFISGDRHLAELSMMDGGVGYPLYDLTSSGLNRAWKRWRIYEENRHRVGTMNWGDNFGVIEIDWSRKDPLIRLQIRDGEGDIIIQRKIFLSTLQAGVIKK
jgi:alkaline phosphatase D